MSRNPGLIINILILDIKHFEWNFVPWHASFFEQIFVWISESVEETSMKFEPEEIADKAKFLAHLR